MDSYDTGVCAGGEGRGGRGGVQGRGGRGVAETIFWVQLPGNNEISRFNSWASLLWSRKKKTKVNSKHKTGLTLVLFWIFSTFD